jgi:putative hemolysin
MGIGAEVLVIVLLVVINGVLAMSEIAVVSARKVRLRQRAADGHRGAAAAVELAADPGRFLSTVQIGITLVGILAGVFGGARVSVDVAERLARWPVLAPYADTLAVALVVVAITYLSLVLGEIVPKQIALTVPEAIAGFMARPLKVLGKVASPLVFLLERSSRLVLRLVPLRRGEELPITEEELEVLLAQGTRAGVFEAGEQEIVARVVRLGERRIGELATPRSEMVTLDANASATENWKKVAASPHAFFPVYESTPDRVLGIVAVRDLWREVIAGREPDLRSLVTDPLYLPETLSPLRAIERVRSSGRHVALVLDEHGGIEGLVTLHDLLQALVGALPTATDGEPGAFERPDGSWLVDGMLPIEQLMRSLGVEVADAREPDSHTVGGLVMERLGRLPEVGSQVTWEGIRFEVIDMDGRRVDKVLATRAP